VLPECGKADEQMLLVDFRKLQSIAEEQEGIRKKS